MYFCEQLNNDRWPELKDLSVLEEWSTRTIDSRSKGCLSWRGSRDATEPGRCDQSGNNGDRASMGVICILNSYCSSPAVVGGSTCRPLWINWWDHTGPGATQGCLRSERGGFVRFWFVWTRTVTIRYWEIVTHRVISSSSDFTRTQWP